MSLIKDSYFLDDKKKANLTRMDIFDKVINLKITTGIKQGDAIIAKDTFMIRSDYEVYYPNQSVEKILDFKNIPTSTYVIRKCQHKPSIRVDYKMVTNDVGIEIDIYIDNFFLMDASGSQLLNLSDPKFPIVNVKMQCGYFGQFNSILPPTYPQLLAFLPQNGVDTLNIEVCYATVESLPPNYTLHIHGYVGANVRCPPVADLPDKNFMDLSLMETMSVGDDTLDKVLFKCVTQRFKKSEYTDIPVIPIMGYMLEPQAKLYGVQVHCTDAIKELYKKAQIKYMVDSKGKQVKKTLYVRTGWSAYNTIQNIMQIACNAEVGILPLPSGDYLVCTTDEFGKNLQAVSDAIQGITDQNALKKDFGEILPAIYDINTSGGIATVSAPFYYWLYPADKFTFENRYNRGNQVAYYTGDIEKTTFRVLSQCVSFDTTGTENEMKLNCVIEK